MTVAQQCTAIYHGPPDDPWTSRCEKAATHRLDRGPDGVSFLCASHARALRDMHEPGQLRKLRVAKPKTAPKPERVDEIPFMRHVIEALGARADMRIHRQNCGKVVVRDRAGNVRSSFDAGPPNGAADVSGIVRGGYRLEIEFKSADGAPSDAQRAWQRMIESFGGIYVLVDYVPTLSLEANVARAVELVEAAVARRMAKEEKDGDTLASLRNVIDSKNALIAKLIDRTIR